jgi:hypothetical protein
MPRAIVAVRVTPHCLHPDGWSDHGQSITGFHLVVSTYGVWVDGKFVIQRDRRQLKNRQKGHPWLTPDGKAWTGFRVDVETGGTR